MSPRRRIGRRPDHWSSPHERARARAAERLDAPLTASENTWLETHLADCEPCATIARTYAADRQALRDMRDVRPEPPRDLWARTSAAIERESAARRRRERPARPAAARRGSVPALGALSGLAVVVVVVIATAVSGGFLGGIDGDGQAASGSPMALVSQQPVPTAIAVGAGQVHWLGARDDGAFAYNVAAVNAVCPLDRQPDCAPFADGNSKRVTLAATPRFIFQSPVDDQAVVVGTDAAGADAILVVALPTPDPTPPAAPDGSTVPFESPAVVPSETPVPVDTPTISPSEAAPASLVASGDPTASESIGPDSSGATTVAIITDVILVGRSAGYSPDGAWFAFSARPVDGSVGPDIYVWHVGDPLARPLTTDHASVFASWVGGSLLGSRIGPDLAIDQAASPSFDPALQSQPPVESGTPVEATAAPLALPETFLLDPWTAEQMILLEAEWQPSVDPTGRAVVAWRGTLNLGADGLTVNPASGNLVIHPFRGPVEIQDPTSSPSPSAEPATPASPEPSADGVAPSASAIPLDFPDQVVAAGPIADFDARWDDTGTWLAIWIADPLDPLIGRLSLLHFDPVTGLVDRPAGAPQDVTALPGFSIGLGRLAWATPPGQGGEGSRIQIAAWTANEVGAIESVPVEGAIVIQ